jgi:hypothetical protein
MENFDFKNMEWLEPWTDSVPGMEEELDREVSAHHPLYHINARAVARRMDNDDVLFYLLDHQPPLAVVHLTWREENSPDWPYTLFYDSIEDFRTRRMRADALDFESGDEE